MSGASPREQLAARLVEAAASAICRKGDPHCMEGLVPAMVWQEAREATGAVLRELAAKPDGYLRYQEDGGITYTKTLRGLADYIEKGQEGSDG